MGQTRQNKVVTITNDEIYDLANHLARLSDSIRVIIPVSTTAERDALVKYTGMMVQRLDIGGMPVEQWNGTVWIPWASSLGAPTVSKALGNSGSVGATFATVDYVPSFAFLAGRKYRIRWDFRYQISTVNTGANVLLSLAATTDPPTDTALAVQLNYRRVYVGVTGDDYEGYLEAWYEPSVNDTRQVKAIANCPTASIVFTASSTGPRYLTIEDMGWQG